MRKHTHAGVFFVTWRNGRACRATFTYKRFATRPSFVQLFLAVLLLQVSYRLIVIIGNHHGAVYQDRH